MPSATLKGRASQRSGTIHSHFTFKNAWYIQYCLGSKENEANIGRYKPVHVRVSCIQDCNVWHNYDTLAKLYSISRTEMVKAFNEDEVALAEQFGRILDYTSSSKSFIIVTFTSKNLCT